MQVSLQTAYKNLRLLEQVDVVTSASYRQSAQDILADSSVSLRWRQAISDRLNHANYLLTLVTVGSDDDSY